MVDWQQIIIENANGVERFSQARPGETWGWSVQRVQGTAAQWHSGFMCLKSSINFYVSLETNVEWFNVLEAAIAVDMSLAIVLSLSKK